MSRVAIHSGVSKFYDFSIPNRIFCEGYYKVSILLSNIAVMVSATRENMEDWRGVILEEVE